MNSVASITTLRSQLVEVYRRSDVLERQIVQLFSVIYEPLSRSLFTTCFATTGLRDSSGKALNASGLKYRIDKLLQAGLLIQESGQGPQCHPLLMEIATRDAIESGTFPILVKAVNQCLPIRTSWKNGPCHFHSERQFIREIRIALYRKDTALVKKLFDDYYRYGYTQTKISLGEVLERVCNNPFDRAWMMTLPDTWYEPALVQILHKALVNCTPATEPIALLQEECAVSEGRCSNVMRLLLVEQLLMQGNLLKAQDVLTHLIDPQSENVAFFGGWMALLQGRSEEAIALFTTALKALRKASGRRQAFFDSATGLFFVLALLHEGSSDRLRDAEIYANQIARNPHHSLQSIYAVLEKLAQLQQGQVSQRTMLIDMLTRSHPNHSNFESLIRACCLYWVDVETAKKRLPNRLEPLYKQAKLAGYDWLAMEAAELLGRLKPRSNYAQEAAAWRQARGIQSLVDVLQAKEVWELCLNALAGLKKREPSSSAKSSATRRLAWFITFFSSHTYLLQPREQSLNAQGTWSKGRPIALKRLKQTGELDYLSPQDLKVCAYLESDPSYYKTDYRFGEKAIAALIGHPLVFWEDSPTTSVEIVKGEPELIIKKVQDDQLSVEFSPPLQNATDLLVLKETPTRLRVIELTEDHRRIAEILGSTNQLMVPSVAQERVLEAISAVAEIVTVHSDIGGSVSRAEAVPADAKPHVHLLPAGEGLKVAVLARPFAQDGPYYRPGTGGATVIADIDGKRLQTTRNLQEEQQRAEGAIAACPTLTALEDEAGEWLIPDPEVCLELLLELQDLGDTVVLEWPEGEKLRVNHRADLKNFRLVIERQRDWFEASGELKLSDQQVLNMQQLMELLQQSTSRFIPLGNGEFLALTQTFRKRLDELRMFSEQHGKGVRFHPLASMALEELVDEVGSLKADKHWKAHLKRLQEMQALQPELPSTLQAELRDYQVEGFAWLARLAHWGVGACLADDMGLGKTLQALALILTRAPGGPTLIVAPTSVCMNWVSEAERFAPTLKVIQFGGGDRQSTLDQLQPFDMLVCSYGLLQQDEVADMLAKLQWQTIVLDEAQAIKNFATKRSQAAMKLQGGFKLITTGTPIENHLGELWNLFRFINPGLLGSLERFNQQFANPIERYQDKQARNQLKRLIQPFILRRTKSQVLEELPSRTEIALHVELSQEEMAMYEALRRDALERLANSDAMAGTKHLQVLAEIMKLRRMCCNPKLVRPDIPLNSSKLQLFGEVLQELLANRHKTLVFSQFVDHLHIIRAYLDEHKIHYQYLDGSTPASDRKKRVDAFQSGEGDVFLISLKAGGTGLNLTAADYVIHMDPWWNPAVEDQASDRAHRIGQQRPVTIYRLVTKNTIEEKIVDLHQHKRDLADSLLEGADVSGKISTDDLLRLMQIG